MRRPQKVILVLLLTVAVEARADTADRPFARVEGELFSGFRYSRISGQGFNEFELDRAELGLRAEPSEQFGGEVRLEAIRSAGRDSVTGIDGDSLTIRVKRAWGYARLQLPAIEFEARGGLIPDLWIEALERTYDFRAIGPTLGERAGFFDTSDLGAALYAHLLERRLAIGVAISNGEGRNQIEQNSRKNVTALVSGELFALGQNRFYLHGAFRHGSIGPASSRSHRGSAALAVTHPNYTAGAEYARAYGVDMEANRVADGVAGWLSGYLPTIRSGAVIRLERLRQSVDVGDSDVLTLTSGLYADAIPGSAEARLRIYALTQVDRFGDLAGPFAGVPEAADSFRFLVLLSVHGATSW